MTQKILSDLADNGRLDGHYTPVQINRALHSLQNYEQRESSRPAPKTPVQPSVSTARGGSLPFSGLDLALFGAVGGPMLLLGASLGRLMRPRPEGELS